MPDAPLHAVFGRAEIPLLLVSAGNSILDANSCVYEEYGYQSAELRGRQTSEFLRVDSAGEPWLASVLQYGRLSVPGCVVTGSGAQAPVEIIASRLLHGGALAVLVVLVDSSNQLTARRCADRAAKRFHAMIEHSRDHVGLLTSEGVSLYASPSTRTLLGCEPEEIVGTNVLDLVHPDDVQGAAAALARCVADPSWQAAVEVRAMHADGQWRWLECVATNLLDDPAVRALVVNSRDITQRRLLHEQLRTSEQRYLQILDTASEGIWTIDAQGRTTFVNRAISEMLGYSVQDITGKSPAEFGLGCWPATAGVKAPDEEPLSRLTCDLELIRRDGTLMQAVACVAPLLDASGNCAGAVATIVDVTERIRLERRLRHTEKMRAVGQLAGGIAHHFNNLLAIILGSSDRASRLLPLNHEAIPRLDAAKRAAMRGAALTSQLLTLGSEQFGRPELLDLNEFLRRLTPSIRRIAGELLATDVRYGAESLLIRADAVQLEQAVLELVANARDAMGTDGRLVIETECTGEPDPTRPVVLQVRDSGHGIDPETEAMIFEPFFTTARRADRRGLGLAIVQSVAERCGGTVHIDSSPQRGTTVTLRFPQHVGAPASREAPRSLSVLVVDDEADLRLLVAEILADSGYSVTAAKDGSEAVSVARKLPALDILLTDVVMPGAPGPTVAAQIRQIHPDVLIAYMSGYADGELVPQVRRVCESPLLLKPFTPSALEDFLRTAYANHVKTFATRA